MQNINLVFVRGDTVNIEITKIVDAQGNDYVLSGTDRLFMGFKKHESDEKHILRKEITCKNYDAYGNLVVTLYPNETRLFEKGEYVYDVKWVIDENAIYTIVPLSKALIVNSITELPKGAR